MQLKLLCEDETRNDYFLAMVERWGLINDSTGQFALVLTSERLELRKLDESKLGAIYVDLTGGSVAHRRKFGGGKGQAIAKAVGLKKGGIA